MSRRVFLFCTLLLALAAAYTIASAWVTVQRIARLDAAGNATSQSQQVLSALHAFASAAVDIESAARGYALTGSDAYLQPFDVARREAPKRLDELRDLLRGEPTELDRVSRLTALLAERIAISERAIAQKRTAPDEPFALRSSRGRETTDEIRRIVDDIESDERQGLASRKSAWQQELERARTTEAVSALSSLTVITLSLWALLRLRRIEMPARLAPQQRSAAPQPAAPPPPDFETLVDDTLRRAAMLQASHPTGSAERARVEMLREAIESARAGVSPADARAVLDRLGLPTALSALAHEVREAQRCTVRESIDDTPPLALAHSLLIFRAASWAFDVVCSRRGAGDVVLGLAAEDAHVVLHVQSQQHAVALAPAMDAERARLAEQVLAAGGTWHWTANDEGQGLTVTLPIASHEPAPTAEPEPIRA